MRDQRGCAVRARRRDPSRAVDAGRAGGEYPAGTIGEGALAHELRHLRAFARRLAELEAAPSLAPHPVRLAFALEGEDWSLSAAFADLRPAGLVRARYDDTRAVNYLGTWIAHLVLCAAPAAGARCETRGLSRDGEFRFDPLEPAAARAELETLLRLYRQGLCAPLHFFPKSAWAFLVEGESAARAQAKWSGGRQPAFGESADPAYRLALRGEEGVPDERFYSLARTVVQPLLAHIEDARLEG